jgi:CubicO group peptidase (beta-lactamase class C family)
MTRAIALLALLPIFAAAAVAAQRPSGGAKAVAEPGVRSGGAMVGAPSRAARLSPDQPIPRAELEAFIDGVVRQSMATDHIVGVAVSVVQAGTVVFKKGYGFANLEEGHRVDPDTTLFRIGSITKTFTWIGLMKAVEAGKLGLDDPVNDYLPPELRIPDQGFTLPIRIKHLMMHSPGFEDRALGQLFEKDSNEVRPLARYLRDERPARVREPGLISSYSNYGVALAAAAVQHIEGRLWQDAIETEILGPLGLTSTSVREPYPSRADLPRSMPPTLAANLSKGYRWAGVNHRSRDYEYITHIGPAGVMSAAAGDIARYMLMLLNDGTLDGVRVFGPVAATAFRSPMTAFPADVGNWDGGFMETRLPGGFRRFGHGGATLSFFSNMALAPELKLGVFVTTNTEGGGKLTGVLPARIVDRFYAPPTEASAGSRELVKTASIYRGEYLQTRRRYGGLQAFLFRLTATQVDVTPDGYLTFNFLGQNQRFVPANQVDQFRSVDDQSGPWNGLLFRREGDRAVRIEVPEVALERVGPLFWRPALLFLTALTLLTSLAVLVTAFVRRGRGLTATRAQRIAGYLQTTSALVWIASAVVFGVFMTSVAGDQTDLIYNWPTPPILIFSTLSLVGTLLAASTVLLLPAVWRRGPGVATWTWWRKLRFTAAALVFVVFGGLLGLWGALQPWNP